MAVPGSPLSIEVRQRSNVFSGVENSVRAGGLTVYAQPNHTGSILVERVRFLGNSAAMPGAALAIVSRDDFVVRNNLTVGLGLFTLGLPGWHQGNHALPPGALDPALKPGDLILADGVQMPDGRIIACDATQREAIAAKFGARGGLVAGDDEVVVPRAGR